jgi:glucose-6-phosphate isomerase
MNARNAPTRNAIVIDRNTAWSRIAALDLPELKTVFDVEPDRLDHLVLDVAGLRLDWSKTHLTRGSLDAFIALANTADLVGRRDALFAGEALNVTEGRAAEHMAERGEGNADSVARAKMLHNRMRALIDAIDAFHAPTSSEGES